MPPKAKGKSAATSESGAFITIKDGDKTYNLSSDELGPGDDLVCRQQTGFPVTHFFDPFAGDSMTVVIWMARRKSGEPNLGYQAVLADYPTYKSLEGLEAEFDEVEDVKKKAADEDPLDDSP